MTGEQIWKKALGQLRSEVERSSFDSWLRDTEVVDYDEERQTIVVGTFNTYARDWLADRMTSTCKRVLTGIVGHQVSIEFVVMDEYVAADESVEPLQSNGDEQDEGVIRDHYRSEYDRLVKPQRIISFPRYYLRWLPILGTSAAWIPIGFRQTSYLAHYRSGRQEKFEYEAGRLVTASAAEIAHWSGMSRASFWRHFDSSGDKLSVFIQQEESEGGALRWNPDKNRLEGSPNTWSVEASMPLTPGDAAVCERLLRQMADDKRPPLEALAELHTTVKERREDLFSKTPADWDEAQILHIDELVESLWDADDNEREAIKNLAGVVSKEITREQQEVEHVSHYFVEKAIPILGPSKAWLVTVVRRYAYYNARTDELRDRVTFKRGYEELAELTGISAQSIRKWLNEVQDWNDGKDAEKPFLASFLRVVSRQRHSSGQYSITLDVFLPGEPLTPEDEKESGIIIAWDENEPHVKSKTPIVKPHGKNETPIDEPHVKSETPANEPRGKSETPEDSPHVKIETPTDEPHGKSETPPHGKSETVLKDSLRRLFNEKDLKSLSTTTKVAVLEKEGVVEWDLNKLLLATRVESGKRKLLTKQGVAGHDYLSWLLYWCLHQNIADGVGNAISRMIDDPGLGAGPSLERVASLTPATIITSLEEQIYGGSATVSDRTWQQAMHGADPDRLRTLWEILSPLGGGADD